MNSTADALFVGIDIGTSGVRALAIDADGLMHGQGSAPLAPSRIEGVARRQDPKAWWQGASNALAALFAQVSATQVRSLAVDGTSGTVLVTDREGEPLSEGWMYDDASCVAEAARVSDAAPAESAVHGASSPLARMLRLQTEVPKAAHLLHQADWIAGCLMNRFGASDANNALKLGWDAVHERWPDWMETLGVRRDWLPRVQRPGTVFGTVAAAQAADFGLSPRTRVVAGTTDGVAAFLATGAGQAGDAVTSLGTTLVLKLVTAKPVFAPRFGVYSHRIGDLWLAGGASNSGGGALLRYFTPEQIDALTPRLAADQPTGTHWHPLPGIGERFPVADPSMRFEPDDRPSDDVCFLQALLEGVTEVEAKAYALLARLGGTAPARLWTLGGGARNPAWSAMRERRLRLPMMQPRSSDAAYGAALLALRGFKEASA